MSHNRLTVLPPDVGYLTHLTQLSALHNAITDVPPEVGNLRGPYLTQNLMSKVNVVTRYMCCYVTNDIIL